MKKWMAILVTLFVAMVVGWGILTAVERSSLETRARYHMYHLGALSIDRRDTAAAEIRKLGPAGVRILVAIYERQGSRWHRAWVSVYPQIPEVIRQILPAPANLDLDRRQALLALGAVGPLPTWAIPVLRHALQDKDKEFRCLALMAIGGAGPAGEEAAAVVGELCLDADEEVRGQAVGALLALGPAAQPAYPAILRALEHPDAVIRANALSALEAFPRRIPDWTPHLTRALEDSDPAVSTAAFRLVGTLGHDAAPVSGALVRLLMASEDPRSQTRAISALQAIGPGAAAAIPALTGLLSQGEPSVRARVPSALVGIDPTGITVAPALTTALGDSNAAVRQAAIHALAGLRPRAPASIPVLRRLLSDPAPEVRLAAVWALIQHEIREPEIFVPLLLRDGTNSVIEEVSVVADLLGRLGSGAKAAVPWLRSELAKTNANCLFYAARSLWQITGEAEPAVSVLPEFMPDRQFGFFPCEAARVLGQIGPAAQSAVPVLARRARCSQNEIQRFTRCPRGWEDNRYPSYFAAEAWWRIAHETNDVLPVIAEFALDKKSGYRPRALLLLAEFGPAARGLLDRAAQDPSVEVRKAAQDALARTRASVP